MANPLTSSLAVVVVVVVLIVSYAASHGYMNRPIPRSRLWRYHTGIGADYDYNGINCNGIGSLPYNITCPVCGSEKYNSTSAVSVFSRNNPSIFENFTIDTDIVLTANHLGFFLFEIETDNGFATIANETVSKSVRHYKYKLKIPKNMLIENETTYTFRWTYVCGNNWGCDINDCGLGHGIQEIFRNCADVMFV